MSQAFCTKVVIVDYFHLFVVKEFQWTYKLQLDFNSFLVVEMSFYSGKYPMCSKVKNAVTMQRNKKTD